jgi:hypothetical protein
VNLAALAHRRHRVERYISVDALRNALRAAHEAGDRTAVRRIVHELKRPAALMNRAASIPAHATGAPPGHQRRPAEPAGPGKRREQPPGLAGPGPAAAPDAHALQRERVVASLVLHPNPRTRRHASGH